MAKSDKRITDEVDNISIVGELPFDKPFPGDDSPELRGWISEKSNHYLKESDLNAIFFLQNCFIGTPTKEADFALKNYSWKTVIFLERAPGKGDNSVQSMYSWSSWESEHIDPPIYPINYKDFKSAWRIILRHYLDIKYFGIY